MAVYTRQQGHRQGQGCPGILGENYWPDLGPMTGSDHGADENRDGSLVEAATLTVPLLDAVQGTLASQVKHEKNRYSIVADEG